MRKQKQIDPIPDEFSTYEEAAEFWDTHDTTDYPDAFRTVEVKSELRQRHYEVEIDSDVMKKLRARAKRKKVSLGNLASDLLRQQLSSK
jgi:predicted transcriptional regulator